MALAGFCSAWLALASVMVWPSRLGSAEIFSSIVHFEQIVRMEESLAESINTLVQKEESRLQKLRDYAAEYRRHSSEVLQDVEGYLAHPVNAFRLVKRFTDDWASVETLIRNEGVAADVSKMVSDQPYFPSENDLTGAVKALMRLQDTYALKTSDLAQGNVKNLSKTLELTASDCFEIGRISHDNHDYHHAILWVEEALSRYRAEGADKDLIVNALGYLSYDLYMQGNPKEAHQFNQQILDLDPSNVQALHNRQYYDAPGARGNTFRSNPRIRTGYHKTQEFDHYERLCRGEKIKENPYRDMVSCQYSRPHPYYWVRPLKEEVLYIDPFIAVYHDLVTESEIEVIKSVAKPRLHRSYMLTGQRRTDDYRISQSAWLYDKDHELIKKVSDKVSYATGLSLQSAEELQVLNYGMGGQYEPHTDWSKNITEATGYFFENFGNRISTSLYYMSDVAGGGGTVFPGLGVHVAPEKGMMLLWYNLHKNGSGDIRTVHAGCPVLVGSKWVCNKWIHERYQEFARPCALSPFQ